MLNKKMSLISKAKRKYANGNDIHQKKKQPSRRINRQLNILFFYWSKCHITHLCILYKILYLKFIFLRMIMNIRHEIIFKKIIIKINKIS